MTRSTDSVRSFHRFVGSYRLTAIGVPLLTASAFVATHRLDYTVAVAVISAAALVLVDSHVRDIVEEPEDDEL